jgi:hypothetical protein
MYRFTLHNFCSLVSTAAFAVTSTVSPTFAESSSSNRAITSFGDLSGPVGCASQ